MTNFLDERLRTLAQLRKIRDDAREKRHELFASLHATEEWIKNEQKMVQVETAIFEAEDDIKSEAVNYYLTAGEKNPHAGVKVKVFRQLEIDDTYAKEYCLNNLPQALLVQKKPLEKVLKALPDLPEWASEIENARAQITADLTKVFGALDEVESRPLEELETAGRIIDAGAPVEEQIEDHGVMVVDLTKGIECIRCQRTKNSGQFLKEPATKICDECIVSENDDIPF